MDRTDVAGFYRGKGYQVHESIVVTGQSGNQQRVPLLCEGPLGNLAVFFGDAGGIDGPEIGAAKRVARDLGATAVVAAGQFTGEQRGQAAELGVVLLDDAALGTVAEPPRVESAWPGQTPSKSLELDLAAHPWPASGRPEGRDGPRATALSDIDVLLDGAPATTPAARTAVAPRGAPVTATPPASPARTDAGGLWKHTRTPTPQPDVVLVPRSAQPTTTRPAAGRFAWLDVPQAAAAAEIEVDSAVLARAAPRPLTPEELAAERHARLLREANRAVWIKRGAWTLGTIVAVWLFLIWWI